MTTAFFAMKAFLALVGALVVLSGYCQGTSGAPLSDQMRGLRNIVHETEKLRRMVERLRRVGGCGPSA